MLLQKKHEKKDRLSSKGSGSAKKKQQLEERRQVQSQVMPLSLLASEWHEGVIAGWITYKHPFSWPDWVLTELPEEVFFIILTRTIAPPHLLYKHSLKHSVHIGDNITIDASSLPLLLELSMGYKFLLPTPSQPKLIQLAWTDFCEHLRWHTYFTKKMLTDLDFEHTSYDPDYAVPSKFRREAPKGHGVIEAAIQAGEAYINNVTANLPLTANWTSPWVSLVKRLHDFLSDNGYIVLPIDKNLGIFVVTREWFVTNTQKLLDDKESYTPLDVEEHCHLIERKVFQVTELAGLTSNCQLQKFFSQFVPEKERGDTWQT